MRISEVIQKIKDYHYGLDASGKPIDETKTRDKVLFGDTDKECTGIVTTCFASAEVIRKAIDLGCNLIICHEALFWNHGDHTDWLEENKVFQKKRDLLASGGIVVWRDHDYIHSGIPEEGEIVDGIFYGVMDKMGWRKYVEDVQKPNKFTLDEPIKGRDLVTKCLDVFNLNGVRIVGDINTECKKVMLPMHLMGEFDNETLAEIEENDFDCLITMEITDFTVSEYIRDSAMLKRPRLIIEVGHFNVEEPGMEYMLKYVNKAIGDDDMPVHFVKSADGFDYVVR